jgi:hypothetical protein
MTRSSEVDVALKAAEPVRDSRAIWRPRRVQPVARESFGTADRDDDTGWLDVVAGGEFLDDRIRLRE